MCTSIPTRRTAPSASPAIWNTTDTAEIVRAMKKKDRARRSYYEHYTGQHWGDCHSYDITLNSGSLGVEACVQLICAAVKAAENK